MFVDYSIYASRRRACCCGNYVKKMLLKPVHVLSHTRSKTAMRIISGGHRGAIRLASISLSIAAPTFGRRQIAYVPSTPDAPMPKADIFDSVLTHASYMLAEVIWTACWHDRVAADGWWARVPAEE